MKNAYTKLRNGYELDLFVLFAPPQIRFYRAIGNFIQVWSSLILNTTCIVLAKSNAYGVPFMQIIHIQHKHTVIMHISDYFYPMVSVYHAVQSRYLHICQTRKYCQ